MSEFPDWPLVYVEWVDSTGSASWQSLDPERIANETSACKSIGWLAKKTKAAVTLYSDLAKHSENRYAHGHSEQVIPMGCVKRIVKVKEPK